MVVAVDVGQDSGVTRVLQMAICVIPRVCVDTAPAKLGKRVQIVSIGVPWFQHQIAVQFRYECGRSVHPAIIRQLSSAFFDPQETTVPLIETLQKQSAIFK